MTLINKIKTLLGGSRFPMIGVDISENSIALLQLKADKSVRAMAKDKLPAGLFASGWINDAQKLADLLKSAVNSGFAGKNCLLSFPDKHTYFLVFPVKENNKEKIIQLAAQKLPLDLAECYFDYTAYETENGLEIFFAAAEKKRINQYLELFSLSGLNLAAIDFESASLARALLKPEEEKKPVIIIDSGANSTDILLHDNLGFRDQLNVPIAGVDLSRKISELKQIGFFEANKLKKQKGLESGEPKVRAELENLLAEIILETKRIKESYENKNSQQVGKIILAGGTALTRGLLELFEKSFPGLSVELADAGKKISFEKNTAAAENIFYANVAGLALRGLNEKTFQDGLNLINK